MTKPEQHIKVSDHSHAEKVKVGQVPFLPFISSSSALLQLSVEPCQTEKVETKKIEQWAERGTDCSKDKEKIRSKSNMFYCVSKKELGS